MSDKEIKNISVIEITVKDKDTKAWGIWNKYIKDIMSCTNAVIDADVEKAKVKLTDKGYEILDAKVICCLSEVGYDKSIINKLNNKQSYIQDYSKGVA